MADASRGLVVSLLGTRLTAHVLACQLGVTFGASTAFALAGDPDAVVAPDVAFLSADRIPAGLVAPYGVVARSPDLAIEVMSPHAPAGSARVQPQRYLEAGVREVWVVHPRARTVTIHHPGAKTHVLTRRDVLYGGDVVPGFACPMEDLFLWSELAVRAGRGWPQRAAACAPCAGALTISRARVG